MPRLGWQMKADRNGEKQSAYEIEVRNAINKKTVYKTGKIRRFRCNDQPTPNTSSA